MIHVFNERQKREEIFLNLILPLEVENLFHCYYKAHLRYRCEYMIHPASRKPDFRTYQLNTRTKLNRTKLSSKLPLYSSQHECTSS